MPAILPDPNQPQPLQPSQQPASLPTPAGSGNPVLDEIDNAHASLSPHAKLALSQAIPSQALPMQQPAGQPAQPQAQPSPLARGITPKALPSTQLQNEGSGISQIHNGFARIPLQIADAVGSAFFPRIAAGIPGTQMHHEQLVNEQRGNEAHDQAAELEQAKLGQETAQTGEVNARTEAIAHPPGQAEHLALEGAQTDEAKARAESLRNPQDKWEHLETDQGIFARNPRTNELMPLTFNGQPLKSKPPADKGETGAQDDQKYEGLVAKAAMGQHLTPEESAQKTAYEKRKTLGAATTNVYAREREDRAADRQDAKAGDKQDLATRQGAFKAYGPALDSAERFNVMAKNYEDAVHGHNQQAELSLLANHLGMTMGLQKGARLNKDIIQEAQQSRPWLQGMEAKFDKDGYLQGVTLTQPQMRQMVDLGRERFSQDLSKSRNESKYLGAQDDGPERTPSRSTLRYYLGQTGGDTQKAKQLAAEDGWTVK